MLQNYKNVTKLQKCYKTTKMLQKLQNRINMIRQHVKPNVTKDHPTHTHFNAEEEYLNSNLIGENTIIYKEQFYIKNSFKILSDFIHLYQHCNE